MINFEHSARAEFEKDYSEKYKVSALTFETCEGEYVHGLVQAEWAIWLRSWTICFLVMENARILDF